MDAAARVPAQRRAILRQENGGAGIAGVPLGDLFALANAIAGMVGGAVTIEDPSKRVLAYSTLDDQPIDGGRRRSILGRQVPDIPGMGELYRQLSFTAGVMTAEGSLLRERLEIDDLRSRSAVAIRAGTQTIGSIWVVHDLERLSEESERALAEAARIAVPHVIRRAPPATSIGGCAPRWCLRCWRADAPPRRRRAASASRRPSRSRSSRSGSRASSPRSTGSNASASSISSVYCEVFRRSSAAVAVGENVYVFLQGEPTIGPERLVRLAHEIQAHAETRFGVCLLAAIGSTVEMARRPASPARGRERPDRARQRCRRVARWPRSRRCGPRSSSWSCVRRARAGRA